MVSDVNLHPYIKVDLFPYDVHLLPITIEARSLGGAGKRVKERRCRLTSA